MSSPGILSVSNLSGGYGSGIVLRQFSAEFHAGEVHCIVGRNGVGKSTLLKLLAGELKPAGGEIRFRDHSIVEASMARRAVAGLSYAPQDKVVFDDLTVAENLTLMRKNRDVRPYELYLETFPRLRERLSQKAGTLSGGEKKLLSVSRTLAENRHLVLLDEPTEGVQYENVVRMGELIARRKADGACILLVEQSLGIVKEIGDRITVLDHGETVLRGDIANITKADIEKHLAV